MLSGRPSASKDPRGAALSRLETMVDGMRTLMAVSKVPVADDGRNADQDEVTARLAADNIHCSAGELLEIFRRFRYDVALNDLPAIDAEIDELLEADPTGEKKFGHVHSKDDLPAYGPVTRPEPRPLFKLGEPGSMARKQQLMKHQRSDR
mmetsp:Transcript_16303/g.53106  ORF Transcript_16303/g.53106 Transcript_16303/m.53106 type:complete len:150 (+) Transcript_16303:161-610(+)